MHFTPGVSLLPLFMLLTFLRQCWIALQMDWAHFLHVSGSAFRKAFWAAFDSTDTFGLGVSLNRLLMKMQ